jgi:acylphosphatase
MSQLICKRFVVSGKVQGVFFRASTRQQALQLGIRGYAKNLANGSVEVLAMGPVAAVGLLEQWLWQGPPTAKVSSVEVLEMVTHADHAEFETL